MIADAELLRRYAEEKNEEAFAELVRRQVNFVYACALRRVGGSSQLAEDVTQQVFVALARDAARLSAREVLSGWLFTTTRNLAVQVVRGERRRLLREQEAHSMQELTASSAHDAEWIRLRPVIDAALDELPERDREAVLLRFFEGKSFVEIGARLRLPENSARMRVERALDKLHALLARRGVTSTATGLGLALAGQAAVAAPAGLAASATTAALTTGGVLAGSGVLAAFLNFMTTTKILIGAAAAIALGVAINESSKAQDASRTDPASAQNRPAVVAEQAKVERVKVAAVEAPPAPATARPMSGTGFREGASPGAKTESRPATVPTNEAPIRVGDRVGRLNTLVALTADQKVKVTEIFQRENAILETLSPAERPIKGMDARTASREQVREVLTAEQQKIYDRAPQTQGGGLTLITAEAKLGRLDQLVALTPEQKTVAKKIFDEEFESIISLPPAQRGPNGMDYRQTARAQVRAILNPTQQQKYDETPQSLGGGSTRPEVGKK